MKLCRYSVLGLPVDKCSVGEALQVVDARIRRGRPTGVIVAANPEKVYQLKRSPGLRELYSSSMLVLADGIGIAVATRLMYRTRLHRIAGADFMEILCLYASINQRSVYLYGAAPDVSALTAMKLKEKYCGLRIAGVKNGYECTDNADAIIEEINSSMADILFVALGTPKQEEWVRNNMDKLRVPVVQCVGGTFDAISGAVPRAPRIMRRIGCEWLYRLIKQPSRARRQLRLCRFIIDICLTLRNCGGSGCVVVREVA